MSNETKIDYDKIERYLLPHERCILPSHPDIWVKDILTIIRDARQLTAERERVKRVRECAERFSLDPHDKWHFFYAETMAREVLKILDDAQPYAPNNPSPDHIERGHITHFANDGWFCDTCSVYFDRNPPTSEFPAKPCPDCGATDRAHTCPNRRESTDLREKLMEFGAAIVTGKTRSLDVGVPDVAREFVDAILATIDARLGRGR